MENHAETRWQYPEEVDLLVALNAAVANIPDPQALFQVIYSALRPVFHFEVATIILPTPDRAWAEIFTLGLSLPEKIKDMERPELIRTEDVGGFDPDSREVYQFGVDEILNGYFPHYKELEFMERELGVRNFTLCPLLHGGNNIGHLLFGNRDQHKISAHAFPLIKKVMQVVAGAVVSTNTIAKLATREQDAQRLVGFTTMILDIFDAKDFPILLAESLQQLHPFHYIQVHGIHSHQEDNICLVLDRKGWRRLATLPAAITEPLPIPDGDKRVRITSCAKQDFPAIIFPDMEYHDVDALVQISLQRMDGKPCFLLLGCDKAHSKTFLGCTLFEQAAPQMYLAFRNLQSWEQVQILQDKLQLENRALFQEISPATSGKTMVGQSPAFRAVLNKARMVANTDTTVLLTGETGTGKELLARFLHENSKRHDKPMVRVNCASLPAQLIESELFGHEKGSFTGAVEKRLGKFELAHGGTLFLDEIGEMPIESQAKLLRVLQERELERVGGHQVIRVDVRVIVATNRNLEVEIAHGTFRSDLYFRINTFPILLPPLRERHEDIGLLADMFLQRSAKQLGRLMRGLSREDIDLLCSYQWPGNVRELEHVMENISILSTDSTPNLREFRKYLKPETTESSSDASRQATVRPLDEAIANHIRTALRQTHGRIGGLKGAAALLGLNPKTLESKMRKLGIQRRVEFS